MAYDRQKQQQQQQFKIDVDANEIVHVKNDEFEGTITATLTRGNRASSGQQVQLFLAGHPIGNPMQTDGNGKIVKDFSITTSAKTISVEAQTVGFATRTKKFIDLPRSETKKPKKPLTKEKKEIMKIISRTELAKAERELETVSKKPDIELESFERDLSIARLKTQLQEATKEEPPKKPADVIPHVCGTDGDYAITWEVLTEDKSPVPGVIVQISDAQNEKPHRNLRKTDKKGCTSHRIKFTTKERFLTASVLGGGVSTWINLFNQRKEETNGYKI